MKKCCETFMIPFFFLNHHILLLYLKAAKDILSKIVAVYQMEVKYGV